MNRPFEQEISNPTPRHSDGRRFEKMKSMNRRIAATCAWINGAAVLGFALCMLTNWNFGSYLCSMFIAFSFLPMTAGFAWQAGEEAKLAGLCALGFAAAYAAVICLVYFAQLTTVRAGNLSAQATQLLDFQRMDLMFNYDLLGYGLMALSTFFAGLAVRPRKREESWLRGLLLGHGAFFLPCLAVPMLGLFADASGSAAGVILLEFWCVYFLIVDILSVRCFFREE